MLTCDACGSRTDGRRGTVDSKGEVLLLCAACFDSVMATPRANRAQRRAAQRAVRSRGRVPTSPAERQLGGQ